MHRERIYRERVLLVHSDRRMTWCATAMSERDAHEVLTGNPPVGYNRIARGIYVQDGVKLSAKARLLAFETHARGSEGATTDGE